MSSAYFCDKYGQAYPYENITIIRGHRHNGDLRSLGGDLRLESVDLCPSCILKFDHWIHSKGEENER